MMGHGRGAGGAFAVDFFHQLDPSLPMLLENLDGVGRCLGISGTVGVDQGAIDKSEDRLQVDNHGLVAIGFESVD